MVHPLETRSSKDTARKDRVVPARNERILGPMWIRRGRDLRSFLNPPSTLTWTILAQPEL